MHTRHPRFIVSPPPDVSSQPHPQGEPCRPVQRTQLAVLLARHACSMIFSCFVVISQRAPSATIWPLRAPIWTKPSSTTGRRTVLLWFNYFLEEGPFLFPFFFVFVGHFLFVIKYVRECCWASTANTAQQSAINPEKTAN